MGVIRYKPPIHSLRHHAEGGESPCMGRSEHLTNFDLDGWICTLPRGHAGEHEAALISGEVAARWDEGSNH